MLIYSMSVSVDGFIADREGAFRWTAPSEEVFRFHLAQVRELGTGKFGPFLDRRRNMSPGLAGNRPLNEVAKGAGQWSNGLFGAVRSIQCRACAHG